MQRCLFVPVWFFTGHCVMRLYPYHYRSNEPDDPGIQLTAKRWMRANANYSEFSTVCDTHSMIPVHVYHSTGCMCTLYMLTHSSCSNDVGTSSVLLPPMPQLIYSYTAEDVVEANTMVARPLPSGLATIPESPVKETPPSASSRLGVCTCV